MTVLHNRRPGSAGLAKGDFLARHVLKFDGDVFEDMSEPGAVVFPHAAVESAGFAVGTTMFGKSRQRRGERIDKSLAEAAGRPGFQGT